MNPGDLVEHTMSGYSCRLIAPRRDNGVRTWLIEYASGPRVGHREVYLESSLKPQPVRDNRGQA